MKLKDAEIWQSWVDANKDPYGKACVDYALRWANLMEKRIADGQRLVEIVKATSHEADTDGVTGFMYGIAVGMLSKAWEHGETLRQWHNLDAQIHDEGERANKDGGTLNPALVNIGRSD